MMRKEFLLAQQAVPAKEPAWKDFTQIVPSTARIENYAWMTPTPGIQRYEGFRRYGQIDQIKLVVPNLEFDAAFSVAKRDVEDDQIGGYLSRMKDITEKANVFPGRFVLQTIAAGTTTQCFDGTNWFASSHNWGGYPASPPNGFGGNANLLTFTSAGSSDSVTYNAVFMLHYGSLKPVLYQQRKGPEFGTTAGTPQSLEQKRYNYWIDLEANALPGWWWDSILVQVTNTPNLTDIFNIIDGVMKQFFQFSLPAALPGDPALYVHQDLEFGANIGTIVCSSGLWALFRHALLEDRIGVSVAGSTAGLTNNVFYGLFKLIGTPYL